MVLQLEFFDVLQGPLDQSLPVQIPLRIDHLRQRGLGLGMLGSKDGAAILIGQHGSFEGADFPGNSNNLFLSMPIKGMKMGISTTAPVTVIASMV